MRNTSSKYIARYGGVVIAAIGISVVVFGSRLEAQIPPNLSGNIDVASAHTERDTLRISTFDQEYHLNWQKQFTDYVIGRGSFRYARLGVDQNENNTWRSELQPSGELVLNHPDFALGSSYRRQVSKTDLSVTNITRDNTSLYFKSRRAGLPYLTLNQDWEHTFNPQDMLVRDIDYRRFLATVVYDYKAQNFSYNYSRRTTENLSSGVENLENDHLLRWSQSSRFDQNRLRVSSNYTYSYSSDKEMSQDTTAIFSLVAFNEALYALDETPEFGMLDTLPGLADGNTASPTTPLVNIGGTEIDRNIGIDMGLAREVSAIYLYTDRSSGTLVNWEIFASFDNLNWTALSGSSSTTFEPAFNRYEILFDVVTARYLKVVNSGVNGVNPVYVTEIQPLSARTDGREFKTTRQVHRVDLSGAYRFSEKVEGGADVTYQKEPRNVSDRELEEIFVTMTGKYRMNTKLNHVVKLQQGIQDFGIYSEDNKTRSASYGLYYAPMATLDLSLSLMNNNIYLGDIKTQENNNFFVQANGNILIGLNGSAEFGINRTNQFTANTRYDTWRYQLAFDGSLTSRADFLVSYLFQHIVKIDFDEDRDRHQLSGSFNYRISQSIFFRGQVDLVDETRQSLSHEYVLSWNIFPRLTVTSLMAITERGQDERSEQYNINANYAVRSRGNFYFTFSDVDYSQTGGFRTKSYQFGYKTGF